MNNNSINDTILLLSRLPGLGNRSARRIVFELMKKKDSLLSPLIDVLTLLKNNIVTCECCNNLDVTSPCAICSSHTRDQKVLCVVEDISSLWAIEKSGGFNGLYFVIGGNLSANKGQTPDSLQIPMLLERVKSSNIKEVIIATSPTIEGQITANYISDTLSNQNINVTQLAQGIPIGGELEYLDETTLKMAISSRKTI